MPNQTFQVGNVALLDLKTVFKFPIYTRPTFHFLKKINPLAPNFSISISNNTNVEKL